MNKTNLLAFSVSLLTLAGSAALVACGDDTVGTPLPDSGVSGTSGMSGTTGTSGTSGTTGTSGGAADGGADATVDSGPRGDAGPDATIGSDAGDAGPDTGANANNDAGPFPAPPVLGAEIDRFGRPAVNTALDHVFDSNPTTAGAAKTAYNADGDAGAWVGEYQSMFEQNLAIYDSLDTNSAVAGSGCGNQLLIGPSTDAGAARYGALAGVLADDRLWLNTASTTCTTYLGVELGVTTDCGGRGPAYDVIMATYSAVAGVPGFTGFGSGVTANPAKTDADGGTSFPYFQIIAQ
ncbi:MAG TPA: hypothetical protein VK841_16235 [Polyangiaceae bacterium]|jgi:hypothetical protein|nr:hypothetical protein [Polyangiaceae bacterium]